MKDLLQWFFFSDKEIGSFQFLFSDYLCENNENISNIDAYQLALLGANTQYNMRILKSRITKGDVSDEDVASSDTWVNLIIKYNGLVSFITTKFIEKFENTDPIKQYEYIKGCYYTYFERSESQLIIDPRAIELLKSIIKD